MTEDESAPISIDDFYNREKRCANVFEGRTLRIVHCKGALDSFYSALASLKRSQRASKILRMKTQVEKLADTGMLSREHYPEEGNLPSSAGKSRRKFKALKRIPIRGYCWHSDRHPNTVFISHYISKDYQKLKRKEAQKVGNNWKRIEEDGDER